MKIVPSLILISLVFVVACTSGRRALERGDYREAVLSAINRLRQSPGNRKARETLADAYPRFLTYSHDRIRQLRAGGDPLKWEPILTYYQQLNEIYNEIQRSPAALDVVDNPRLFTSEYEEARIKAAEARYALGERAIAAGRQGDREAAKDAYGHFSRAETLYPGFRDVRRLAEEARRLAVLYVVVDPIPMPSRLLEVSNEFFYNQLMEYLQSAGFSPFIEFYSPRDIQLAGQRPDHRVQLSFDEFVVGQAFIKETVTDRQRDSVVIGQVDVTENGKSVKKDVYGAVKASVHVFQKAIDSRGVLDCRIVRESSGAVLSQEKMPGSFTWIDYWGFFNGDERALTGEDKSRLRNSREVMPPPPQQLFVEFTKPIFSDLTRYLGNFYNQY